MGADLYGGNQHRRAPLATRDQVVEQAIELLDAEGPPGLSMRKLASALQVSLPTIYAAVASRNQLVQEVLRTALGREVRAVSRDLDTEQAGTAEVLARMVDSTANHPWVHHLAQELDTGTLVAVADAVAADTRPSVIDHLVARLGSASALRQPGSTGGEPGRSRAPEAAQVLFLVVLLLDDVARLVAAGRCPAGRQGHLGQALLRTMLEPVPDMVGGLPAA